MLRLLNRWTFLRDRAGALFLRAGVLLLAGTGGCSGPDSPEGILAGRRSYELLMAGQVAPKPCLVDSTSDTLLIASFSCRDDSDRIAIARRMATLPESLRSQPVLDLAVGTPNPSVLDRIAFRLEEVAARDSLNAGRLSDAAVARAVGAHAGQNALQLFRAAELMERAFALDSIDPVIRFNRALLFERLGLLGEAAEAWDLAAASPGLREESEQHGSEQRVADRGTGSRDQLERAWTNDASVPDSLLDRIAREEPEVLREIAFDLALPRSAETLSGSSDAEPHARWLELATAIGTRLVANRDSTVLAATSILNRSRGDSALAHAMRDYGAARRHFDQGDIAVSTPLFGNAARILRRTGAVALWGWPAIHLAVADLYDRRYVQADARLKEVVEATQNTAFLTLRARALWGLALSLARQDRPEQAIQAYSEALRLFSRVGERTNAGAMDYQLADMYALTGDVPRAARSQLRAARAFMARRDLGILQGHLQAWASWSTRGGQPRLAVVILREAVRVSRRTRRPKDVPEALARLAAAEVSIGRIGDARGHLAEARAALVTVTDPAMRAAEEIELTRVEARLLPGNAAIAQLDRVVEYYADLQVPFSLAPALLARATARLSIVDTSGAERDMDRALLLVRRRAGQLDPIAAAATRDVERDVFQQRVAIRLARGDSLGALTEVDRHTTWMRRPRVAMETIPARMRPGEAILAYAALPERLIIWGISRDGVQIRESAIGAASLRALVLRMGDLIRIDADSDAFRAVSEELYRFLIRPMESVVSGRQRITIVADPAVAALPFAALRSPDRGNYLVETAALRFSLGVGDALDAGVDSFSVESSALVVGDPAFDRTRSPELAPLRQSAAEADSVSGLYANAHRLTGTAATPGAVLAGLQGATLFHFSGHAITTGAALRGSRLVLAADGALLAEQIAALRLPDLRLVVLSACETLSRQDTGSYRLDGLAEAFLAAGAQSVVGSLWAVDDESTTRLMSAFHRALRSGADATTALRAAQLSSSANLRTWAAFRLVTR